MSSNANIERGKRTGAKIATQNLPKGPDGLDDPDAFFQAIEEQSESSAEKSTKKKAGARKAKGRSIRFSVGPDDSPSQAPAATEESRRKIEASIKAIRKMINNPRDSISPSEISRASTAPRPFKDEKEPEDDSEEEEEEQETEIELEVAEKEIYLETEAVVAVRQDGKLSPAVAAHQKEEDEGFFPTNQDDGDDDEEDMIPPPPPESPEPDDPEEDDDKLEEEKEDDEKEHHAMASPADFPNQDDDDDEFEEDGGGDDDKEGNGFEMMEEDGAITPEHPSIKRRKKGKNKHRNVASEDDESSEENKTPVKKKKKEKKRRHDDVSDKSSVPRTKSKGKASKINRFATTFPKGIPMAREYTTVPVSDLKGEHDGDDDMNIRRSQRARIRPLQFWKGERVNYGPNPEFSLNPIYDSLENMPVPKAIERAERTPYKPRKVHKPKLDDSKSAKKGKQKTANGRSDDGVVTMEPFNNAKIRKKYPGMVTDGDEAYLWDETIEEPASLKVLGYKDALTVRALPMGAGRLKSEGKVVCRAAQAFNISNTDSPFPGYLMGSLFLPPRAIKDAESVGTCAQTFTCVYGQPGAIEVAYGDPDIRDGSLDPMTACRFFIQQGDMFRIPPGNCYRLENHSKEAEGYLTWTIIRPSEAV